MTREQTREAAQVMLGWADGKEVQYRSSFSDVWIDVGEGANPLWNWTQFLYRIKPTPVLRPWTADEVPLGAWVRLKNMNVTRSLITNVGYIDLWNAFNDYEHSTDGGLTWKPCGVEEVKP